MYKEQEFSAWFREQATLADQEFKARKGSPGAEGILARSCVYGYLYERYFLETPELLLNELRWLRTQGKPGAPRHAQSAESFNVARDALLDQLIERIAAEGGG